MTQFQESCGSTMPPQMPQQLPALISLLTKSDGKSTLRSWMHRKYIVFDDSTRNFCKTDEYIQKHRLAS